MSPRSRICDGRQAISEQLVHDAPSVTHFRSLLAECQFDEYRLATATGDPRQATWALHQSTQQLTELIEITHGSLRPSLAAARNHSVSAWRWYHEGNREAAGLDFDKTRDLLVSCVGQSPNAMEANVRLAWILAACPVDHSPLDQRMSRAVELAERAVELDSLDPRHRRVLAVMRFFAGDSQTCADMLREIPSLTSEGGRRRASDRDDRRGGG